jgi:hypothetical protein
MELAQVALDASTSARVGQMTHSFTLGSGRIVWERKSQWWIWKEANVGRREQGHLQALRRGGG